MINPPSVPAITANRVCIQGNSDSARPCSAQTNHDVSSSCSVRSSAQKPVNTTSAPGPSGNTVKLSSTKGAATDTAAQPNHAAGALDVARQPSHQASAQPADESRIRNTTTP